MSRNKKKKNKSKKKVSVLRWNDLIDQESLSRELIDDTIGHLSKFMHLIVGRTDLPTLPVDYRDVFLACEEFDKEREILSKAHISKIKGGFRKGRVGCHSDKEDYVLTYGGYCKLNLKISNYREEINSKLLKFLGCDEEEMSEIKKQMRGEDDE